MTSSPGLRQPVLCLVTDRRRIGNGGGAGDLIELAKRAVDAGIDLFQIREPDLEAAELYMAAAGAVAVARGSQTRIVMNDRLDVALAAGTAGVHLRGDSLPAARARELAPRPFLIGWSVHQLADLSSDVSEVDYLIAGTVFQSASKPEAAERLGTAGLAAVVEATRLPVLAIGGVTADRAAAVAATGAAGIAAIGAFADTEGALAPVAAALRAPFASFDRAKKAFLT